MRISSFNVIVVSLNEYWQINVSSPIVISHVKTTDITKNHMLYIFAFISIKGGVHIVVCFLKKKKFKKIFF